MPKKPKFAPSRLFISHASEDKDTLARPLAVALTKLGHEVWYDEFVLTAGDSLKRSIDKGLAECDFGVVILSKNFFAKRWPQEELGGLAAREMAKGEKHILPVWHKINADTVRKFSPTLADRIGIVSSLGLKHVVEAISASIDAEHRAARSLYAEYKSPFGGRARIMLEENIHSPVDPKDFEDPKFFDQAKVTAMMRSIEKAIKKTRLKKR